MLEKVERETGIEPVTSSLGIFASMGALRCRKCGNLCKNACYSTLRPPCIFEHFCAMRRKLTCHVGFCVGFSNASLNRPFWDARILTCRQLLPAL